MAQTEFYSHEPSRSIKTTMRVVLLLFLGILSATVLTDATVERFVWVVTLFILIITIAYLFRPKKYILVPNGIRVGMTLVSRTIANVVSVEIMEKDVNFKYRIFGIVGIFSIVGRYATAAGGRVTAYLTDETQGHVVEIRTTEGERVLISPRDPVAFVAAWVARGVAEGAHGTIPSRPT
jgi:hypothetical protein